MRQYLRAGAIGSVLFVCFSVLGCTLRLSPKDYALPPGTMPPITTSDPIEVRAGKTESPGRVIVVSPFNVRVAYEEFTKVAVRHLQEELLRQKIRTDPKGKMLELSVMYVDILRTAGSFTCIVDYRVTTGSGVVRGLQGRGSSWNYEKACDAAIANVSASTLRDSRVEAYLAGEHPSPPVPPTARSREQRLRELQRLEEEGLLTPDEYEAKRREILRGL